MTKKILGAIFALGMLIVLCIGLWGCNNNHKPNMYNHNTPSQNYTAPGQNNTYSSNESRHDNTNVNDNGNHNNNNSNVNDVNKSEHEKHNHLQERNVKGDKGSDNAYNNGNDDNGNHDNHDNHNNDNGDVNGNVKGYKNPDYPNEANVKQCDNGHNTRYNSQHNTQYNSGCDNDNQSDNQNADYPHNANHNANPQHSLGANLGLINHETINQLFSNWDAKVATGDWGTFCFVFSQEMTGGMVEVNESFRFGTDGTHAYVFANHNGNEICEFYHNGQRFIHDGTQGYVHFPIYSFSDMATSTLDIGSSVPQHALNVTGYRYQHGFKVTYQHEEQYEVWFDTQGRLIYFCVLAHLDFGEETLHQIKLSVQIEWDTHSMDTLPNFEAFHSPVVTGVNLIGNYAESEGAHQVQLGHCITPWHIAQVAYQDSQFSHHTWGRLIAEVHSDTAKINHYGDIEFIEAGEATVTIRSVANPQHNTTITFNVSDYNYDNSYDNDYDNDYNNAHDNGYNSGYDNGYANNVHD